MKLSKAEREITIAALKYYRDTATTNGEIAGLHPQSTEYAVHTSAILKLEGLP